MKPITTVGLSLICVLVVAVIIVEYMQPVMVWDLKPGVYRAADVVQTDEGFEGSFDLIEAKNADGIEVFLGATIMGTGDPNAGCVAIRSIHIRVRAKDVITMGTLPAPKDATMYLFVDADNGMTYLVALPNPELPEGVANA